MLRSLNTLLKKNPLPLLVRPFGRAAVVRAKTKGRTDAMKQKTNARYAIKILMAARSGGSDPDQNKALNALLIEAKAANVPKDVIKRNIEKSSDKDTKDFKESLFEFYGFGKVGLLVTALTNNDNRAAKTIAAVANKRNLKSAAIGSVSFNFVKRARIDIFNKVFDDEKMTEICLECDVDDYDLRTEVDGNTLNPSEEGNCVVYVDMADMSKLREYLRLQDIRIETSLRMVPLDDLVTISEEDFEANMSAIEALEALEDVDIVEHNIDMTQGEDA